MSEYGKPRNPEFMAALMMSSRATKDSRNRRHREILNSFNSKPKKTTNWYEISRAIREAFK